VKIKGVSPLMPDGTSVRNNTVEFWAEIFMQNEIAVSNKKVTVLRLKELFMNG